LIVRIAHFSDIHVQRRPDLAQLFGKRLLASANLYLLGRRTLFLDRTIERLVEAIVALAPDAVICTGDLTAMALPSEFEAARAALAPIIDRFPFLLVPGNHDTYTLDAWRERQVDRCFGDWTNGGRYPWVRLFDEVAVVGLNPCHFHPFFATGRLPEAQGAELEKVLEDQDLAGRFVILLLHHPLRGRDGEPYRRWMRNLRNAGTLEAALARHGHVGMILHGHVHHGYRTSLPDGTPIFDPGSGGIAHPRLGRTAHFNLYEVDRNGLSGVERWAFDGERFVPETGGAYASGL
jgi:3',5'-cyclic AMP phosphodiesterase CpdA